MIKFFLKILKTHTIWVLTQKTQSETFDKNQEANNTTIDIMIMDHITK